jgi:penicillin-binding protein 2
MYQLVSTASRTRFGDPAILGGNYGNAHEYVVSRTSSLLLQAEVYALQATPGRQRIVTPTTATVPVHVVMQTIRVGPIAQDLTLPLVREGSHWRVNWSPGLVFAQLDDPSDPQYQRRLHLFAADAHRGKILDRDGNALATDDTVYQVGVVPGQIANESKLLQTLASDLDFTPDEVKQKYQGADPANFILIRTINQQLYAHLSADLAALQGVVVRTTVGRVYPYGADAAAVTGYVKPVSDQDLLDDADHYYEATDTIGGAGIEQWAEKQLRPTKGGELDIVRLNADGTYGTPFYTLARRSAVNGDDVQTTISLALQQRAMADARAAGHPSGVVALDPPTGQVLELASTPIYDPNDFSLGFTPNEEARFNALDHPYVNRAVAASYPVGSVFKITTLSAALENGYAPTQQVNCSATYQVPGEAAARHDDHYPTSLGPMSLHTALAVSCDTVFWQISVALNAKDPNLLPTMARGFGYGALTGIVGLPDGVEDPGVVPDPTWFQQHGHGGWSPTDAANLAIGQGFFQATPLQIAAVAAAVANNGQRLQPRLVSAVVGTDGQVVASFPVKVVGTVPLSADQLAYLQSAMLGPTLDPDGTAYPEMGQFPVPVAGKTGTAESGGPNPHSLFICYAPAAPASGSAVTPRIALGIVVERSSYGETFAVPIAKDLLKLYLNV